MSDEDNTALNQEAKEEVSPTSTPDVEPKATEEVSEAQPAEETETEENTISEVETPDNEEKSSKKGAQQRIRELNRKAKEAESKAASLEDRLKEYTKGRTPNPAPPNVPNAGVEPLFKPGEESLTAEELNQRLAARDQQILRQAANISYFQQEQAKVYDRIQKEAGEVVNLYPQLNPNNKERFDSDLSDAIVEATEAYVKTNPTGSVKEYVSRLMKPYEKSVNKAVSSQTKTIAKQVAQSAAKPTQVAKSEKDFSDLSIKEMEEQLGIVN